MRERQCAGGKQKVRVQKDERCKGGFGEERNGKKKKK